VDQHPQIISSGRASHGQADEQVAADNSGYVPNGPGAGAGAALQSSSNVATQASAQTSPLPRLR